MFYFFLPLLLRMEEGDGPDEYSDVEGEEPYYPETERVHHSTTRSGRKVFAPQRLIVDPYVEDPELGDEEMSIHEDEEEDDDDDSAILYDSDEDDPEADYVPEEEEDEEETDEDDEEPSPPFSDGEPDTQKE
jgi:hypothetical protein